VSSGSIIVLMSGRPWPQGKTPTAEEKIALFDTLFAYVGSNTVEKDRVIHMLDGIWNRFDRHDANETALD
jgi:hypothetical protein